MVDLYDKSNLIFINNIEVLLKNYKLRVYTETVSKNIIKNIPVYLLQNNAVSYQSYSLNVPSQIIC